ARKRPCPNFVQDRSDVPLSSSWTHSSVLPTVAAGGNRWMIAKTNGGDPAGAIADFDRDDPDRNLRLLDGFSQAAIDTSRAQNGNQQYHTTSVPGNAEPAY